MYQVDGTKSLSRRRFIQRTAAVAGSAFISGPILQAAKELNLKREQLFTPAAKGKKPIEARKFA